MKESSCMKEKLWRKSVVSFLYTKIQFRSPENGLKSSSIKGKSVL